MIRYGELLQLPHQRLAEPGLHIACRKAFVSSVQIIHRNVDHDQHALKDRIKYNIAHSVGIVRRHVVDDICRQDRQHPHAGVLDEKTDHCQHKLVIVPLIQRYQYLHRMPLMPPIALDKPGLRVDTFSWQHLSLKILHR